MKNRFFIFFGFILFSFLSQAASPREHALSINAGTIPIGNFEVYYDYRLDKHFSISSSAMYYDYRAALWRAYSEGIAGGLGFVPKLHIFGDAHDNSFYIGPSVRTGYLVHPSLNDPGILLRIGANFGYQHVFSYGLLVDVMVGIEGYYKFAFTKEESDKKLTDEEKKKQDILRDKSMMFRPYLSAAIGYAF